MSKFFLYHENGWRMFQAERLPVKPTLYEGLNAQFYFATEIYESEISALKAKAIPVGNPDFINTRLFFGLSGELMEWPGDVIELEAKEARILYGYNNKHKTMPLRGRVAILTLPKEPQQ